MNEPALRDNSTPVDIDVNEILVDYGLEGTEQFSTVIQQGNSIITIPTPASNSGTLEPPAITNDNFSEEELSNITNELFNSPEALEAVQSVNEEDYPAENEDSDNTEVEELLNSDTSHSLSNNESNPMRTIEEATDLLPNNPKMLYADETTSRFSGAIWYEEIQKSSIIIGGAGGISSYVCFCLSRMHPKQIFIYDDDTVERVNLGGQLYSKSMIGRHKVDVMAELVEDFSDYQRVFAIKDKFTTDKPAGDIMICGFDNMRARKDFFNVWVNHLVDHPHPEKCLFLDGRLSMEEFQVFCITGDCKFDIQRYQKEYLFSDWNVEETPCSMKQTTYCANMIGSVMVNLFTNFISNQIVPYSRDLPFKTFYDGAIMYFKTET